MRFSGQHPVVERANKFENGCIGVHGWWFNFCDLVSFVSHILSMYVYILGVPTLRL